MKITMLLILHQNINNNENIKNINKVIKIILMIVKMIIIYITHFHDQSICMNLLSH